VELKKQECGLAKGFIILEHKVAMVFLLLFIEKKAASNRLCLDYCALNFVTTKKK
jgi:hypothetical protein